MLHHQFLFSGGRIFHSIHGTNFQLLNIKTEQKIAENVEKMSFQLFKHGARDEIFCVRCSCLLMLERLFLFILGVAELD